jgi:hypothetical protein
MSDPARDSDPLLRAVARGDEHCPDGKVLVRLGRLLRSEVPAPANVSERVIERLALDTGEVATIDEAAIDRHYDAGSDDPQLERLGILLQTLQAAPVDLRAGVRRQLTASMRLPPVTAETPVSSRAQAQTTAQRTHRLRLIVAVIGVHVAALLAIALMQLGLRPTTQDGGNGGAWTTPKPQNPDRKPRAPEQLPASWLDLPGSGFDLLALRRSAELRALARERYHLTGGASAVTCGLRWLIAQQQLDGSFAGRSGAVDTQLGTAALATLALLGEGDGSSPADTARLAAITAALPRLETEALSAGAAVTPATRAKLALVRVEAVLLGLAKPSTAVTALAALTPDHAQLVGDGFAVLAIESALQAGLQVDPQLRDGLRSDLLTALPLTASTNRLATAAFARLTLGWSQNPGTEMLLTSLDDHLPTAEQRQPAAWLMPALAAREAGGERWEAWAPALVASLVPAFTDTAAGLSCLPATAVPDAPDSVAATAAGVLALQVGYRYLPTQAR